MMISKIDDITTKLALEIQSLNDEISPIKDNQLKKNANIQSKINQIKLEDKASLELLESLKKRVNKLEVQVGKEYQGSADEHE